MLYNIPIFMGFNLEKETLARLVNDFANIVAIKDEAGLNPIPLRKAAINLCGLQVGPPRLPLAPATEAEIGIMRTHLARLGLI
jgi:dihydrodipicolinate synthase/N-acetylneuraminate lyase